jgi:hypothetical protein
MALLSTFQQASALIRRGLAEAHHLSGEGADEFLPLQDLASGIERLCKGVLWSQHWVATGQPVATRDLKKRFGHNIVEAVDKIADATFPPDYTARPAIAEDQRFVRTDPVLRELLGVLADFGSGGRYFDLDVAGGTAEYGRDVSPTDRLDALAELVCSLHPELDRARFQPSPEGFRAFHAGFQRVIRITVEKFTRAMARLFTLGPLKGLGAFVTPALTPFLVLMDSDLGSRSYSPAAGER